MALKVAKQGYLTIKNIMHALACINKLKDTDWEALCSRLCSRAHRFKWQSWNANIHEIVLLTFIHSFNNCWPNSCHAAGNKTDGISAPVEIINSVILNHIPAKWLCHPCYKNVETLNPYTIWSSWRSWWRCDCWWTHELDLNTGQSEAP